MNKQDLTIIVLLFAGLIAWSVFFRPQRTPKPEGDAPAAAAAAETAEESRAAIPAAPAVQPAAAPDAGLETPPPAAEAPAPVAARPLLPERTILLTNAVAAVTVSSWGGGITRVELSEYRETLDADSGPVVLDLTAHPALALAGIAGLSTNNDFELATDGAWAVLRRTTDSGLAFERRITLGENYRLDVVDTFRNAGAAPVALDDHALAVGTIEMVRSRAKQRGITYLGMDTLADRGGVKVQRLGRKVIPSLFGGSAGGCSRAKVPIGQMPLSAEHEIGEPLTWAAAKNKFFVQILKPERPAESCMLYAARDPEAPQLVVERVWADLQMAGDIVKPGGAVERRMSYYVGPKKFSLLTKLGARQDEVMLYAWWEWFRWICRALLVTLNGIHSVIPGGYGVAIILLTLIVRVIFWPVTHKSTESMKRMQQLQPLVAELKKKYKDKPQKLNQETMALYKEHKVNPMAGCLPLVIQMPVFIALFTVLRSAVELRYAGFLWIADLSEPEGLFQGALPLVKSLNILPIVMAATMFWQQKLTPTGGDSQQQKMMMFMPVFMLFLLYNMPSALMLYWSVSQVLSIVQLIHQRRRSAAKEAAAAEGSV